MALLEFLLIGICCAFEIVTLNRSVGGNKKMTKSGRLIVCSKVQERSQLC